MKEMSMRDAVTLPGLKCSIMFFFFFFKAVSLHNMRNHVTLWYAIRPVVHFAFYIFRQCSWVPIIIMSFHTDSYRQIVSDDLVITLNATVFSPFLCACKCSVHARVLRCNQTASYLQPGCRPPWFQNKIPDRYRAVPCFRFDPALAK